jgi:hypothetical protein
MRGGGPPTARAHMPLGPNASMPNWIPPTLARIGVAPSCSSQTLLNLATNSLALGP